MLLQKRTKASSNELVKQDKHKKQKKIVNISKKNSSHLKSYSKEGYRDILTDVTPQKQKINIKHKVSLHSHPFDNNSRHMKSCINNFEDRGSQKQSRSMTKRKTKKQTKLKIKLLKKTDNFNVLCRCLTQYVKQQKKIGRNPNPQIFRLIKAFNSSQIGSVSKQLQNLIKLMLEYIQETLQIDEKDGKSMKTENNSISQQFQGSFHDNDDDDDDDNVGKTTKKQANNISDYDLSSRYVAEKKDSANNIWNMQKSELQKQIKQDVNGIAEKLNGLRNAQHRLEQEIQAKAINRNALQKIIQAQQRDIANVYTFNKHDQQDSDY